MAEAVVLVVVEEAGLMDVVDSGTVGAIHVVDEVETEEAENSHTRKNENSMTTRRTVTQKTTMGWKKKTEMTVMMPLSRRRNQSLNKA